MKLTELEPKWIHPGLFIFRCPHCRNVLLSCKSVEMSSHDQYVLFEKELGPEWNTVVVGCKDSFCWNISGQDFNTMTVTPSLDASNSGHWHGHITAGEIK